MQKVHSEVHIWQSETKKKRKAFLKPNFEHVSTIGSGD